MATDPRYLAACGREIFTGNELLIKGALETEGGVSLLTGYPGSPVAGFFDIMGDIGDLLKSKGIRAFQANNEALGVAAVNGSQMAPCKAIVTFKSVGTHVASDALALGNMAGSNPDGGVVVISGEDPWCESTQVPADSRFLFEHLRMPVVEPGTAQQLKDWIDLSFKLSQAAGLYIGYIVTVAHADGGGTVNCKPNQWPAINTNQRIELETAQIPVRKTVLLPPRTWQKELQTDERFAATMKRARELGINRIIPGSTSEPASGIVKSHLCGEDGSEGANGTQQPANAPIGFIVTGMAGPYLNHVLSDIGLLGEFPVLQMGMSYPVDAALVEEFAGQCRQMIVIEERRSFLEKNIRDAVFKQLPHEAAVDISGRLFGKKLPNGSGIPDTRGLNPSVLAQILIPLIKGTEDIAPELRNGRLTAELSRLRELSKPKLAVFNEKVVARTPTFCPGCPHRDSSSVLMELRKNLADPAYMQRYHKSGPVDLVAHGDTGCYTMLMFAPTEQLMHNYSGMGLGGGTGSGIDPFITNKQIVFMGDGTFFHSGQIAISNSIKANQDITYIILENKTTAMTGHQEHPGTELDALGNRSFIQDIEAIVRGMTGTSPLTVAKLSPADKQAYRDVLEKTILRPGVKVVIADKECGITYHRKQAKAERKTIKEKGYLPKKTHMNVTPEVCENCLECTKATACPGLTAIDTDYGRKIDTDLTWCVNDGACVRVTVSNEAGNGVKPCPSFEQVTVIRQKRRRYTLPHMALDKLPEPTPVHAMKNAGDTWRVHMAGVGGMGIGVVGSILIRAGHKQGYRVLFQDKKGLAIRNGGVYGQMTFVVDEEIRSEIRSEENANVERRTSNVERRSEERANIERRTSNAERRSEGNANVERRMLNAERRSEEIVASDSSSLRSSTFDVGRSTFDFPRFATTGAIPYGKADLLLGVDILEAARALDPREQFRVAHRDRTAAVLNEYKQPTVLTLLGQHDFDPAALREEILNNCRQDLSFSRNLSDLCEQRLGSKQFVNIMMLGAAFQLGLIPVSAWNIAWAIKDTIRRDHRKNLKAFNIGRKLALEPRALPRKPAPETWEQLVTNKSKILRKTRLGGRTHADRFEMLVQGAMKAMRDLPEESKYDLTLRIYDLLQYQDAALAKRYVDLVRGVYRRDDAERHYSATNACIWNLAKVMLIKDEPYVAYLLTRPEKKQRDLAKYNVDVANGDKLVYRHHTSPEFNIGKFRLRFKITTTDWQLNVVRHMKWWRKLPGWHARECGFRDWYIALLERVSLNPGAYASAVAMLKCPEEVTGYREVRYPKMDRARQRVETELANPAKLELEIHHEALPERVAAERRTPAGV